MIPTSRMTKKKIIDFPVNRLTATFQVNNIASFKQLMLSWANRFNIFLFLDSHSYGDKYSTEEWVLAADAVDEFSAGTNIFEGLRNWLNQKQDWLFGHLNYDLKNEVEQLSSAHPDGVGFPDVYFFQPAIVIRQKGKQIEILSTSVAPGDIFNEISSMPLRLHRVKDELNICQRFSKEEYLQAIEKLRQHILRGDCYEINFCQEFFAENAVIDPLDVYHLLAELSPTPFGGFYKLNDKFLLCASPERFLQKKGDKIISQPIKGTIKRNTADAGADQLLKQQLHNSGKDRSENVMVVDLVRNDLSRVCKEGSVHVEELYGIYTFPQVHQMVSTIAGELEDQVDLVDILRATFPMGSMTGAPKVRVMQLAEQYERTKRGIYSGAIGYITPGKDFDFNVVIRSIMYNASRKYLSYQVGGGITFLSDPEKEYEECLLKAEAIKKVLRKATPS
jgi:para-aminobenzoate synthetase component I